MYLHALAMPELAPGNEGVSMNRHCTCFALALALLV
jgi:hypothetical protein